VGEAVEQVEQVDRAGQVDRRGVWATLREAVRGTDADLTAIPIRRAVLMLAVPTVLEMSMESLLTIVDIFFVSRLGSDAIATVGLTESMLSPMYALAMGLSAGATAIIARFTGEKNRDGAATAAVQAIGAALLCAAACGLGGSLAAPQLLSVMGASESVVSGGSSYTALMLGGSVTIFLLFVVNGVFRSAGDAATAMRALWVSNILNMALAPCFIFGLGPIPALGVFGAAVATTLSRGVGVCYQILVLVRGRSRLAIARRHVVLDPPLLRELIRLATPATMQMVIETASWIGLVRIISTYGSLAVAGYTIAVRIVVFVSLPAWGLASATATLVGQSLGAKKPQRARQAVSAITRYNFAFLAPVGVLLAAFPLVPIRFFSGDAITIAYAVDGLRIIAVGFVVFAYGMVAIQALNGAGDTKTPMFVNLASFWLFKIPAAWFLAKVAGLGPRGVFLAVTAAYTFQSLLAGWCFRRGGWEKTRIAGSS
jgi:putative MATE family efflux protein